MRKFIKGAWLYKLEKELTEIEFIKKAGGLEKLEQFNAFPYVSLILDVPDKPMLVGHNNGRTIALAMNGHEQWQTMEWL